MRLWWCKESLRMMSRSERLEYTGLLTVAEKRDKEIVSDIGRRANEGKG